MADISGHLLGVAVVTPEGAAFEGKAKAVVVPAHDGEVAFLPGHAAFLGALGVGELRIQSGDGPLRFFVEGGVVQVVDGMVTVLAEAVLPVAKLDPAAATKAVEDALAETPTTEEAFAARDRRLDAARAKLRVHARS